MAVSPRWSCAGRSRWDSTCPADGLSHRGKTGASFQPGPESLQNRGARGQVRGHTGHCRGHKGHRRGHKGHRRGHEDNPRFNDGEMTCDDEVICTNRTWAMEMITSITDNPDRVGGYCLRPVMTDGLLRKRYRRVYNR